jgi:hypothetical protein
MQLFAEGIELLFGIFGSHSGIAKGLGRQGCDAVLLVQ